MAGNTHQAQFEVGSTEWDLTVQGVAPRANVISYKICSPGCASSNAIAAVNQAIEDGVDVLNYSISGPDSPWNNAVDLAFLDAFEAGIFVSASAGNTGPMQGTVTKTAPWNATVAASNSPRLIAQALRVTGPDPVPRALEELSAVPGTGPGITAPISAELREIPDNVKNALELIPVSNVMDVLKVALTHMPEPIEWDEVAEAARRAAMPVPPTGESPAAPAH